MSWLQFCKWNILGPPSISFILTYSPCRAETHFSFSAFDLFVFVLVSFSGLWHSVVMFFGCMYLWYGDPPFSSAGLTLDYWSFGTLVYHEVIFVVSLKVPIFVREKYGALM